MRDQHPEATGAIERPGTPSNEATDKATGVGRLNGCGTSIGSRGLVGRCGEIGICGTCWAKRNGQDPDTLKAIIEEFADHQSVRCGWPAGYGQWRDGDCACGLTRALREAGLPVEWAGGPPED